jgi:ABC-type Na+ transport system ATPase subunit NatA
MLSQPQGECLMSLAIELEDLRKTFEGEVRALDGVSFEVETGTIFGLPHDGPAT